MSGLVRAMVCGLLISAAALWFAVGRADVVAASVNIFPPSADAGAIVDLTIDVVNEHENAEMTRLEIAFPEAKPVRSHASMHVGWSATVDSSKGSVASVTWSGGQLAPGESASFLLITTLPDNAPTLELAVVETYSDGSVSRRDSRSMPSVSSVQLRGSKPPTTLVPTTSMVSTSTTTSNSENASDRDFRWGRLLIGVGLAVAIVVVMQARKRSRTSAARSTGVKRSESESRSRRRRS